MKNTLQDNLDIHRLAVVKHLKTLLIQKDNLTAKKNPSFENDLLIANLEGQINGVNHVLTLTYKIDKK